MKKIINRSLTFLLFLCMFLTLSIAISAENTEPNSILDVTIATDKDEYETNEDIQISIAVKNNGFQRLRNLSIDILIPEGLTIKTGKPSMTDISIDAGKFYTASIVAHSFEDLDNDEKTTIDDTTSGDATNLDNPSNGKVVLWIILGVAAVILVGAIIFISIKYKKITKIMSMFFCFAIALTIASINAYAVEQENNDITIEKIIKVNNIDNMIKVIVKQSESTDKETTSAEEFFKNNSEKVISVDAIEDTNILSEKEVYSLMQERGFNQCLPQYEYDSNGNYMGECEIDKDSDTSHPMYQSFYVTQDKNIWSILVVGKNIIANPIYINVQSDTKVHILIGESNIITSYDNNANLFFNTIPKKNAVNLIIMENINSAELDKFNFEEVQ